METAIVISIVSIVISSTIAIWNYRITRENHEMRKDEFLRKKKDFEREEFDRRPKMEITIHSDVKNSKNILDFPDVNCLVVPIKGYNKGNSGHEFEYDLSILNNENWISVDLKLKNIGISSINHLYLAWNIGKTGAMFDVKNDEYDFFIKNSALNYRVIYEKEIKQGQEFTVKVNFHKDQIMFNPISAEMSIYMFDSYNNIWKHPLFIHKGLIYDSEKTTFKSFQNLTNIKDALKCFENPMLW